MQGLPARLVCPTLARLRILDCLKESDEVLERPGMIREPRSDGRRDTCKGIPEAS